MGSRVGHVLFAALVAACLALVLPVSAQSPGPPAAISTADLRNWLSFIASDTAQGRQIFTEGAGVAAAYIADELKALGVEPAGEDGTFFQTVKVLGVRNRGTSTVTVTVRGQTRTFRDGEGVRFQRNQGAKRTWSGEAEFVGYGLEFAPLNQHDYAGRDVNGKVAVFIGRSPQAFSEAQNQVVFSRAGEAVDTRHAAAAIGPALQQAQNSQPPAGGGRGARPDFQTVQRLDTVRAPRLTAEDAFFEFLFSGSGYDYADLKGRAERREALPRVNLDGVRLRIDIEADYEVAQTRLSRNIVARVRGTDPQLRDTYLLYGAHYDHVGYAETTGGFVPDISNMCPGLQRPPPPPNDIIFNGADDDGSGTVTLLALAKAYAQGPKPRRSVLFVWHTGEEAGLYGSQYMADFPVVPMETVAAQLNIDMVGRNKCDSPAEANTLYLVGSDRISTELHQINEQANRALMNPLTLDYTLNDPADLESLYTRSDHYSYAAKGVPIIFFTTGLHADYHAVTDEIGKIDFAKMARIAQLVYDTGWRVANLDHVPVRDNRGPRAITRAGTGR
ncbi:MAG: M28 family peptidase [Vicinamibacterales bacterium]